MRAAAAGGGAGAPGVRLGRSQITRRHETPRWGGTSLSMWKRNNCPLLSLLGASNPRWSEGKLPPLLRLCIPPSLQSERAWSVKVAAGAEVSEGAAAMLGSGKTPGSNPREDRRTAEPGRRLGKKTFKIQSVVSHRHRHQTRHNYAAI